MSERGLSENSKSLWTYFQHVRTRLEREFAYHSGQILPRMSE